MKKVITAGLSFAMAASMLAGCSSKPAENSDSGDKRVLKFDSFSGGNGEEVFTKLAKAFEKANPDVDVQLRFEKELPDVLNKENAKGEYSDVVYYNLGQPSGYTKEFFSVYDTASAALGAFAPYNTDNLPDFDRAATVFGSIDSLATGELTAKDYQSKLVDAWAKLSKNKAVTE